MTQKQVEAVKVRLEKSPSYAAFKKEQEVKQAKKRLGSSEHGPYVRPPELDLDYGEPIGHCKETFTNSGVFQREWTKASVQMNCGVGKYGEAKITMK